MEYLPRAEIFNGKRPPWFEAQCRELDLNGQESAPIFPRKILDVPGK
jgi:hypothetical protein